MPNRLADETSPYLLQHAHNPVDWYPWGPEALERARKEETPILLSVGYSACHWCHVMERESFEDEETARLMNEAFVNVKVDREERPDVDSVYMGAVQAMTGRGGWPLTVFLTPEGEPYYGGTYFPPEPRHGMPSFRQVLGAARDAWQNDREGVAESAGKIRSVLERAAGAEEAAGGEGATGAAGIGEPVLADAARSLVARLDPTHGGFGSAPKFPQPVVLDFLLRHHARTGSRPPLDAALQTLRAMARGGIRDHLGGGFHRYSVDARWLVPHFEKMLYDNALLARAYLDAWRVTGDAELREVAEETLDWLLDDMRHPKGGFFAARDADSEGEEGRYYVWSVEGVDDVLDPEAARLFRRTYDVSPSGNWEGVNILHLPHDLEAVARSEEMETPELREQLAEARRELLAARRQRVPPLRDEKILVGWNGLVIRALAEAGRALEREDYLEAARGAADFLLSELRAGGRLHHVWTAGKPAVTGFLEDYASLGNALLTLHEATLEPRWIPEVRWCAERVLELFRDEETGLLYDTPADGEALVVRPRETMDTATPSGTSLAAELLWRGALLFGEEAWRERALEILATEAGRAGSYPHAYGRLLSVGEAAVAGATEVALVGPREAERTRRLHRAVFRRLLPHRLVAGRAPGEEVPDDVPLLRGRDEREGRPTAYVCEGYACREPVTEVEALEAQLDEA